MDFLSNYHVFAVFLGAFFFGESVIVTAAYLAVAYNWSIVSIFVAAFLGTVISDSLWFLLADFFRVRFYKSGKWEKERLRIGAWLEKVSGKKPYLSLLYIKFLYGVRIAMIFYLASKNVPFSKFLTFNSLGTIIWLLVVIELGVLAGSGLPNVLTTFGTIQIALGVLLVSFILFRLINIWITKRVAKIV